ncbi:hypothetical protein MMPV_002528 [Pyropia vietnamensis]
MKVAVVGARGPVGVATVRALLDGNAHVLAVTRHPPAVEAGTPPPPAGASSPAASPAAPPTLPTTHPRLTIVAGSAADSPGLTATLTAAAPLDGVAVITPGTQAPANLVSAAVTAAATAGVQSVAVVSMLLAGKGDFTYARWMADAEAAARSAVAAAGSDGGGGGGGGDCGGGGNGGGRPRLALVRLANFYENWLAVAPEVATSGVLRDAFHPTTRVPSVSVADAGAAVAAVVLRASGIAASMATATAAPSSGNDADDAARGCGVDGGAARFATGGGGGDCRVYNIVGGVETLPQVASALAAATSRPVTYEPVDAAAATRRLEAVGVPAWAAAAAMEMYAWLDGCGGWGATRPGGGSTETAADRDTNGGRGGDFAALTGRMPADARTWAVANAGAFMT